MLWFMEKKLKLSADVFQYVQRWMKTVRSDVYLWGIESC